LVKRKQMADDNITGHKPRVTGTSRAYTLDRLKREQTTNKDAVALGKHGRPKKGEGKACNTSFKYGTAAHWLARLDRDGFDELAAKVRAGSAWRRSAIGSGQGSS
jgi:hypothetical protein